MIKWFLFPFLWIICNPIFCQNLIPNPSFEEVTEISSRWSGTFSHFNRRMEKWDSPTQGSPDILFVELRDKMFPVRPRVNLVNHLPRTGKFMIGIKAYGCATSTLHCKEYVQIQLKEALIPGEEYFFEYWLCPIESSVKVSSFGVSFGTERMKEVMNSDLIESYSAVIIDKIIDSDSIQWHRVSGTFEADDPYKYIIIGNFGSDDYIEMKKEESGIDYGYYLLDDVLLKPVKSKKTTEFKLNETTVLENILFSFDSAELLESSMLELSQLVNFLGENPNFTIRITGHTDDSGTPEYNNALSKKRAQAVKEYLVNQSIATDRIKANGVGSKQPIVPNDSEENREINRRVEVVIEEP